MPVLENRVGAVNGRVQVARACSGYSLAFSFWSQGACLLAQGRAKLPCGTTKTACVPDPTQGAFVYPKRSPLFAIARASPRKEVEIGTIRGQA